MLLLRALVARFWKSPTAAGWSTGARSCTTASCCRTSSRRTCATWSIDLQRAGYAFALEWFAPFFEFRFPRYGTVAYEGIELELRQAIEPWHVLGEEVGGTRHRALRRFVGRAPAGEGQRHDRRAPRRHLQRPRRAAARRPACTASTSPACATGPGRRPRRCIPTIGVHAPLVFDLVDTWSGRSLGGCTYHVSHPGGRNYDDLPGQRQRGRSAARSRASGTTATRPGR